MEPGLEVQVDPVRPPAECEELPPPSPVLIRESSVATPQVPAIPLAYAEWTFLKEPDSMFVCEICANVLIEPQLPLCCTQNHICLKCVEKWRARGAGGTMEANCPFCKATPDRFQTRLNDDLKNQILDLEVRCLYHNDGCRWSGKLGDAEFHVKNVCRFLPVCCPNGCNTPGLQRQHLAHHKTTQCEHAVVQCPFQSIGCSDVMQRRDLPVHLQQGIHGHLKEVSVKTAAVSASSSAHLEELREQYESQCVVEESEIASLREKIAQVQVTVVSLKKELRDGHEKVEALREEQERSTAHCMAELREKGDRIVRLRDTHLAFNGQIQAIPAAEVATGYMVPPILFTIDKVSMRKTDNEVWQSPPFYSHDAGYKMFLKVYLNGYGESKGVNMSIFVHFMEGEYDEHLEWPFEGVVTVVLTNQQLFKKESNCRCVISLDRNETIHCRLRVGSNEGYGSQGTGKQCLPLKELGKYLTFSDCLEMRVQKVTFLPL